MHWIDLTILLGFIAYSAFAGLKNKDIASTNLEEYFLAGRSLKGWQAGISMAATQFAADTPLLVTGLVATGGIFSLWRVWIYGLAFLMVGFMLAPSWRRAKVLTDAELTELRYGQGPALWLRGIKAVYFGVIFNCAILAMVLLATTRIAEPFLFWNEWLPSSLYHYLLHGVEWLGVPFTLADAADPLLWIKSANNVFSIGAIMLVTCFYSTTGGLRSVVATDVVQFTIAMVATLIFTIIVVMKAGGLDAIHGQIMELFSSNNSLQLTAHHVLAFTPSRAHDTSLAFLTLMGLQWLVQMNADGTGYLAQRTMACRSDRDAKQAAVIFTFIQVLVRSLLWLPLALGLLVIFPPDFSLSLEAYTVQRESTYIMGISQLLPPGLKGMMLVGMLAALASTLDTHLNWGASYLSNDIYRRFICELWRKKTPSAKSLVWVARLSNLFILSVALCILPFLSSIQTAWQMSLLLGAGMGVMLVMRWFWWRITAWGEMAAIISSLISAPLLMYSLPEGTNEALRLLLVALISTLAGVLASLLTKPQDKQHLLEFFQRTQPPGFWGEIADRAGIQENTLARQKFRKTALTTVLAAFSLFSLLVSVGSYLVGSPAPTWFDHRTLWMSGVFLIGLGLMPVWSRLARLFQR